MTSLRHAHEKSHSGIPYDFLLVEETNTHVLFHLRAGTQPNQRLIDRGRSGVRESVLAGEDFVLTDAAGAITTLHQMRSEGDGPFAGLGDVAFAKTTSAIDLTGTLSLGSDSTFSEFTIG